MEKDTAASSVVCTDYYVKLSSATILFLPAVNRRFVSWKLPLFRASPMAPWEMRAPSHPT